MKEFSVADSGGIQIVSKLISLQSHRRVALIAQDADKCQGSEQK